SRRLPTGSRVHKSGAHPPARGRGDPPPVRPVPPRRGRGRGPPDVGGPPRRALSFRVRPRRGPQEPELGRARSPRRFRGLDGDREPRTGPPRIAAGPLVAARLSPGRVRDPPG